METATDTSSLERSLERLEEQTGIRVEEPVGNQATSSGSFPVVLTQGGSRYPYHAICKAKVDRKATLDQLGASVTDTQRISAVRGVERSQRSG